MDDVAGLTPRALPSAAFWSGKRVFLTGHTGFKGGWLSLWLHQLGATVSGYALPPDTRPNLFITASVSQFVQHQFGDVRDASALTQTVRDFKPDIVLHLAAQPLVRASYTIPVETFVTNIMGTAHLLDAVRQTPSAAVTLIITSDKVYAERSDGRHLEDGKLGGHDPYSASKACAELVTASFPLAPGQKLGSVRSGNVIGGGDWAVDRLLPDFFRSIFAHESWRIRNPHAIRPWQHVLDPLCGYLIAAEHLWTHKAAPAQAWNFGPEAASEVTVGDLAARLCRLWGEGATYHTERQPDAPHEAPVLRLSSEKALRELNWRPGWQLEAALAATTAWFHAFRAAEDMAAFTQSQIKAYCET